MTLPTTARNRVVDTYDGSGKLWLHVEQFGWDQTRPFTLVLPYATNRQQLTSLQGTLNVGDAASLTHVQPSTDLSNLLTHGFNRSYGKLVEEVPSVQAGVNVVEYRQARDMFITRGKEALGLLYLLSRGKFATAGKALGCSFFEGRPPKRNRSKWILPDAATKANRSLSNIYLQWHFGVSPLISDIQDAAKVLTDPLPKVRIHGSSQEYAKRSVRWDDPANPGTWRQDDWDYRVRTRQGCTLTVSNPNTALAAQVGLLNPAALLWEIVPFSFVADWFVNVGDWLQGFSDFAGMTLDSVYSTSHVWTWHDHWSQTLVGGFQFGRRRGSKISVTRTANLTGPSLGFRPLKLPSLSRAVTSWSLVSQLAQRHR